MSGLRVAAAQYPIGFLADWAAYETKATRWVEEAAEAGARLLVFPEYFSMELASLFDESVRRSLPAQIAAMQGLLALFRALYARLATAHRVVICAGSIPVRLDDGRYRNRSYLFDADGHEGFQDKLQMTRFEDEQWCISRGDALRVFDTAVGRLGVAVCYDVEFPLIARNLVEQGAAVLLAPSCTDTLAGYWRVRIGAQARALENQCYVVHAATVGSAGWSPAVDENVGAAAVYTPVDRGFPDDGVLVCGERNAARWVFADLEPGRLAEVRRDGQVLNHRDWNRQRDFREGCDR